MSSESGIRLERLKALVDGTMAIVLTLLVLLIEPPPPDQRSGEVLQDVLENWHYVAAYVLSFVLLGMYWLNHRSIFQFVGRGTLPLVWLNLAFLLTAAFIPFPTALLVEYSHDAFSAVIYGGAHLLCSLTLAAMWLSVVRERRTEASPVDAAVVAGIDRKLLMPPALYAAGIALSFQSLPLALAAFALVPILHLALDRTVLYTAPGSG